MYSDQQPPETPLLGEQPTSTVKDVTIPQRVLTRRQWQVHICLGLSQVLFFMISTSLFFTVFVWQDHNSCTNDYSDYTPMWSPALEAVKNTGHLHRFNGSFAAPNAFKGAPNPSIDRAWEHITYEDGGVLSIDEATLHAVNASREFSVELAPEIGGGYMASVEVLHQLHCLNMLRQVSYEDYYKTKGGAWKDTPQVLRMHLDHCIDNLRQKLMCDADTGILTYIWVKDHPAPFPDFSVQHKCRDYSSLRAWIARHQTYTPGPDYEIVRQPGAREMENPP